MDRICTACHKPLSADRPKWVVTCGGKCERETAKRRQQWKSCELCGVEFRRKTRSNGGDAHRFCSRECGFRGMHLGKSSYCEWKSCAGCGIYFQAKTAGLDFCSKACSKHPSATKTCSDCMNPVRKGKQLCEPCRVQRVRAWRASDAGKISKRKSKAVRRARKAGVVRAACTIKDVLRRYGSKCYLCGCQTEVNTTHNNRSATIDHVVPLSLGGWHDLINLRIACHSCNSKKSAKFIGQLMLTTVDSIAYT